MPIQTQIHYGDYSAELYLLGQTTDVPYRYLIVFRQFAGTKYEEEIHKIAGEASSLQNAKDTWIDRSLNYFETLKPQPLLANKYMQVFAWTAFAAVVIFCLIGMANIAFGGVLIGASEETEDLFVIQVGPDLYDTGDEVYLVPSTGAPCN